jgi:hypothetical protein
MSSSERQCNPEGNVSFPLRFNSSNITSIPQQTLSLSMSFNSRIINPKFEDESRTSGGFLNETPNSFTIRYSNSSYFLVSSQICLSTHSILLGDDKSKNIVDIILTLETEEITDLSPRFIIVVIPLLKYENSLVSLDNVYLGSIQNQDISGNYSIRQLFSGLNKFLWYQTCLEPHGDNAIAYVNLQGIKVSENLYLNLLGVWKKESPYDIQKSLETGIKNIKNNITDFCQTTSGEDNINNLNNSINTLQASVYVPKRNSSIETWSRYMAPYDIVLSVQTNPVITSSMTTEGFQTQTITGVYLTDSGGATREINLDTVSRQTENPVSEEDIRNDLRRISQNSVDGQNIDLGEFKCVSLDMDGAIENNRIHFDSMGIPLTDLYTRRNALRNEAQVNKVSTDKLETYFAYALAGIIGFVLLGLAIRFIYTQWINKSAAASSIIPDNTSKIGFYLVMAFIMGFSGFLIGAAATSL